MKMISSTSRMSISGTTFISAIAPPLLSPTLMPMATSPVSLLRFELCRPVSRAVWESARPLKHQQTNENKLQLHNTDSIQRPNSGLVSGWIPRRRRWRFRSALLVLFREQADLIHTGGADFVDNRNDIAVFRTLIALHVHGLIETVRQLILDLIGQIIFSCCGVSQIDG